MKKLFSIAFVLFACAAVFAQEKTIEQSEFEKIYKDSFQVRNGQPVRETRTSESSFELIPPKNVTSMPSIPSSPRKSYSKTVSERLPGRIHLIGEYISDSYSSKNETIIIADKTYTRDGDGKWVEKTPTAPKPPENILKHTDVQTSYKFLGNEKLNDQTAKVYEKIETSKLVNSRDNSESPSTATTKYWFAEDGRLLKMETATQIQSDKSVSNFRNTAIYEIDPNIKIEAPALN